MCWHIKSLKDKSVGGWGTGKGMEFIQEKLLQKKKLKRSEESSYALEET